MKYIIILLLSSSILFLFSCADIKIQESEEITEENVTVAADSTSDIGADSSDTTSDIDTEEIIITDDTTTDTEEAEATTDSSTDTGTIDATTDIEEETVTNDTTSDTNTEDNEAIIDPSADATADTEDEEIESANIITNLTGYIQDGPCLSGADVFIYPLDSVTLAQTGAKFQGVTINDFGEYGVPAEIDPEVNPYAEIYVDVACHNEITGAIMLPKMYRAIVDWTAGETNNVNPPTTATVPRIIELYTNPSSPTHQDLSASKAQAEQEYMLAHNITGITVSFTDMELDSSSDANAALVAMNIIHLYGNNEAEQSAFLADLGEDLKLDGTTDSQILRDKIKNNSMSLQFISTRDNLKARYQLLGHSIDSPKFWNFIDSHGNGVLNKNNPQSFVNIIDNKPTINYTFNLSETCSSSFDTVDNRFFAFPYVFEKDVTSDFIGTNVSGEYLSWYDNNDKGDADHNNDWPGTELITSSKMPQNFFQGTFEDTELNEYTNLPSELHVGLEYTFIIGIKYWKVIWADENYQPSMGCPVGLVPFARNLHSTDGINWIGSDQNGSVFRGNKFRMFITN